MLDENLPTFYLRSSADNIKHNASILLSHLGSDAVPEYSLRHPDPALPSARNRYAVALYDSYNPEILFGEVLLIPQWSQNQASKEEIRLNGGIPPPPQPVLPTEFIIQLYNPDQQVTVKWHPGGWSSAAYWEFEMPQQSFRRPSTSALDRTQSDPTASENTPKLGFKWKKDGKLSKDYICSLSEKSTNPDGSKRKNKEPDITVALFRQFKEITVYEPNLARVDLEDPKGFEVVLLLGAIVIREVYNSNMRETFNITDHSPGLSSSTGGMASSSSIPPQPRRDSRPTPPTSTSPTVDSRPPPTDPRTQWELDAEAARLRKQVEREEAERRRADIAETKRVKRMLEEEKRKDRERQKEVDRETERLKKIYGKEERASLQQLNNRNQPLPPRHSFQGTASRPSHQQPQHQPVTSYPPAPVPRPHSAASTTPYIAHNLRPQQQQQKHAGTSTSWGSPSVAPPGSHGTSQGYLSPPLQQGGGFGNFSSASGPPPPSAGQQGGPAPKKSFWRLKGGSEGEGGRLTKQRSTVF